MNKNRFIFRPEKLEYRQVGTNLGYRIGRILWITGSGLLAGLIIIALYSLFFDTPRERQLREENVSLSQDYELLTEKYNQVDTVLRELTRIDENIYRAIFETDPVNSPAAEKSKLRDYSHIFRLLSKTIVDSTAYELNSIIREVRLNSLEYINLEKNVNRKMEMVSHIPGIQPVDNEDLTRLASGYGERMHPYYKIVKFHSGIDFTAPTGTEVYATGDGTIEEIDRTRRGKGNTVVINHGFGYKSVYSHLDKFNVRNGQQVKRGEVIGWVGNTGLSVAPHLHYEVLLNGDHVDPVHYFFLDLDPVNYNKLLELSAKSGQSFD
jgi:murein DD-endopeptidase MepM/ murein hydrolase activator NlpD